MTCNNKSCHILTVLAKKLVSFAHPACDQETPCWVLGLMGLPSTTTACNLLLIRNTNTGPNFIVDMLAELSIISASVAGPATSSKPDDLSSPACLNPAKVSW